MYPHFILCTFIGCVGISFELFCKTDCDVTLVVFWVLVINPLTGKKPLKLKVYSNYLLCFSLPNVFPFVQLYFVPLKAVF